MPNNRYIKSPWERNYEQSKAQERMDKERDAYDKRQANREFQHIIGNTKDEEEEGYDDEVYLG